MANERFTEIGPLERFPERIGVRVNLGAEEAVVFRLTDGRVVALQNKSPHKKGGIISEGMVCGEYLFDPLYDWKISLLTGEVQAPDNGRVRTYPVQVIDGIVRIGL